MSSSGTKQNPTGIGRRRVVRDSRKRGLKPQDLKAMGKVLR